MHAITVSDYGAGPAVTELPRPRPKPGQVLIAVQAAGLNPMDMEIANGGWEDPMAATVPEGLGGHLAGIGQGDGPRVARPEPRALGLRPPAGARAAGAGHSSAAAAGRGRGGRAAPTCGCAAAGERLGGGGLPGVISHLPRAVSLRARRAAGVGARTPPPPPITRISLDEVPALV